MKQDLPLSEKLRIELYEMIEKVMTEDDITQAEVARRIGSRRNNINTVMRKKESVSMDYLLKIAQAIGLDANLKIWRKKKDVPGSPK